MKKKVLFLCTNNSCRSQMAEGIINHFFKGKIKAFSAGTNPTKVNPRAIKVMQEIGIDISKNRSKHLDEFKNEQFDYVITLCDEANEVCPVYFGNTKKVHIGFPDPAKTKGTEEEVLEKFRKVRDDEKSKLLDYFKNKISK